MADGMGDHRILLEENSSFYLAAKLFTCTRVRQVKDRLKSVLQVWCILYATAYHLCPSLQHSRNLELRLKPISE